jgi:heme-degrading monooxygenase HmoA
MVVEIAEFTAQPGKAEGLRTGLLRGLEVVRRAEGFQSGRLRACVEDHNRFIYEIEWATLEAHTVAFRGGPLFPEYRSHITGLFVEPVTVHHYEDVNG